MSGRRATLRERMDAKTVIDENGCHLWTGFIDKAGYGRIREGGRDTPVLYAHRATYEMEIGPIPDGCELDHLCRVKHCRNPQHLEPVPHRINILRSDAPTVVLNREGRCLNGHPATPENVYRRKGSGEIVYCRPCRRAKRRAASEKRA